MTQRREWHKGDANQAAVAGFYEIDVGQVIYRRNTTCLSDNVVVE